MNENEISYGIRGAAFKVYNELGPGLFESVYETTLAYELEKSGYKINRQARLSLIYKEIKLDMGFRVDLLVNEKVIVEVKSVESIVNLHYKQLLTYLKLSNRKLGLLINFNTSNLKTSIIRIVSNL